MLKSGPSLSRRLAIVGFVVALVAVGTVALTDGPAAGPSASAAGASGAGRSADPDPAGDTGVAAPGAPSGTPAGEVVNPRGLSGWGSSQPNAMAATVRYGTSDTRMSPETRQRLAGQLEQARQVALDIGTVAEAERRGYVKNFQYVDGRGFEYINWSNFTAELDLSKPGVLNFPSDDPDARVASIAYNVLGDRQAGPPKDLPLDVLPWHFHSNLCRKDGSVVGNVETAPDGTLYKSQQERCENLGATYEPELDHWMIDLWVVPGWENPWGLVSSKHPDLMRTPVPWYADTAVEGTDSNIPAGHH